MPRIILKCPYSKPGSRRERIHRENAVSYIATREGVDKINATAPAAERQQKFIGGLLQDFPDAKKLFEYEDFIKNPTQENASELITQVMEQNLFEMMRRENYVDYIAKRPRAERSGSHGLFTKDGVEIVLSDVAKTVGEHGGNVWMPIISLRREDAARMGYDSGKQWRELLRSYEPQLAKQMKIPLEHFRWYASFHNEAHHPHCHMICYSADPKLGWWTKEGAENIKSELARVIFRQELVSIYEEQTQYRNQLTSEGLTAMQELCRKASAGISDNPSVALLLEQLGKRLQNTKGKKVYGYLQPDVKQMVDAIVDELGKDENLARLFDLWYEKRFDVLRTYSDQTPPKEPLSKLTEFKRVKNMVIEEALRLANGGYDFADGQMDESTITDGDEAFANLEPPPEPDSWEEPYAPDDWDAPDDPADAIFKPNANWSAEYKQARIFLFGNKDTTPDFEAAHVLLMVEAEKCNALAMHDLGRMFADGLGRGIDSELAQGWYEKALTTFHAVQNTKAAAYIEYRIGKIYNAGLGTEQDYSKAAHWFTLASAVDKSQHRKGNKYAQYSLAGLYLHGKGVEVDLERAHSLYQQSASQDFPYASYELAKLCRDGIGIAKDDAQAGEHFKKAFIGFVKLEQDSHDDKLQYRIGQMYQTGTGTEDDLQKATEYYELSARLGNCRAQYQLAKIYLADKDASVEKVQLAMDWLKKSVEGGNQFAQYALGKCYRDGVHVEKDELEALRLFTLSAKQDNEFAAYALGKLYLKSDIIAKDVPTAVLWLTKSATLGNQFAQYALGKLYLSGEDVPKDAAKAVSFFAAAAQQGNQFAQYQLGKLYLKGEVVQKDIEKAILHLTASAEQENQFAQYALGKLYLMGKDVPRDRDVAFHWLQLSAAQGNEYARFFIDHIDNFRDPSVMLSATNLLHQLAKTFEEKAIPQLRSNALQIDRKRRRKLSEKKQAQGHAHDDHELTM